MGGGGGLQTYLYILPAIKHHLDLAAPGAGKLLIIMLGIYQLTGSEPDSLSSQDPSLRPEELVL